MGSEGCSSCPAEFYPLWHYLYPYDHRGSEDDKVIENTPNRTGRVKCYRSHAGPSITKCYPTMTNAPATAPVSCSSLGIRRGVFFASGEDPNKDFIVITVGCNIWKHVFCTSMTLEGRSTRRCATTKKAKLLYGDTCQKRRPDCDRKDKQGACPAFDYKKCLHSKSYCTRTCESAHESGSYGLTEA